MNDNQEGCQSGHRLWSLCTYGHSNSVMYYHPVAYKIHIWINFIKRSPNLNMVYHSSIAIILMEKTELVALLNLSSWCLVMVEWLFLAVPWGCLRFVIVVFPDHTHLLFLSHNQEGHQNGHHLSV